MLSFIRCNLCGKEKYETLYKSRTESEALSESEFNCTSIKHGKFGQIVKCCNCGLIYRNPREEPECLARAYTTTVDYTYNYEAKGRYLTFEKLVKFASSFTKEGYLCDIGCYTGIYLDLMRKIG